MKDGRIACTMMLRAALAGTALVTAGHGEDLGMPVVAEAGVLAIGHAHPVEAVQHSHLGPGDFGPAVHPHEHGGAPDRFELEVLAGIDSRYVSEGRDNLPGEGGIIYADAVLHWHAGGGVLFGKLVGIAAWDADYEEVNVAAGYEWEFGEVVVALAAAYLWFPEDDDEDIEVGVSAERIYESGFGLAGDAYWSFAADGWFGEASVFYEHPLGASVTLVPSVSFGVNQGYVSGEHDGFNHVGAKLEGIWSISEHLEVSAHVAVVEPIDAEPGEGLRDLFWGGAAVGWRF